jgi:hypothetical protein
MSEPVARERLPRSMSGTNVCRSHSGSSTPRAVGPTAGYYPCKTCGKVCTSAQQLGGHQNSHRDECPREEAEELLDDPPTLKRTGSRSNLTAARGRKAAPKSPMLTKPAALTGRARPTNNQLLYAPPPDPADFEGRDNWRT